MLPEQNFHRPAGRGGPTHDAAEADRVGSEHDPLGISHQRGIRESCHGLDRGERGHCETSATRRGTAARGEWRNRPLPRPKNGTDQDRYPTARIRIRAPPMRGARRCRHGRRFFAHRAHRASPSPAQRVDWQSRPDVRRLPIEPERILCPLVSELSVAVHGHRVPISCGPRHRPLTKRHSKSLAVNGFDFAAR
jgi:hypothetical protein